MGLRYFARCNPGAGSGVLFRGGSSVVRGVFGAGSSFLLGVVHCGEGRGLISIFKKSFASIDNI